jgi:hypothetical protein
MPYLLGMNAHAPAEPDFGSPEEAAAYDRWLREKVARSLADPRPSVPNEVALEQAREILAAARRRQG